MGDRTRLSTRRSRQGIALVVVLTLVASLSSGCSGLADSVTSRYGSSTAFATPGLYEQPNGTTQALGVLAYRDTEGGFWAVVDAVLPQRMNSAPVVAVIIPDSKMTSQMESYRGKYVSVIGTKDDGPSTYQAGPVIKATSIALVKDRVAE